MGVAVLIATLHTAQDRPHHKRLTMEDNVYCCGPVLWVRSDKPQRLGSGDLQRHFRLGPDQTTTGLTPSPSESRDLERLDSSRCLAWALASQVMATHPTRRSRARVFSARLRRVAHFCPFLCASARGGDRTRDRQRSRFAGALGSQLSRASRQSSGTPSRGSNPRQGASRARSVTPPAGLPGPGRRSGRPVRRARPGRSVLPSHRLCDGSRS